MRILIVEDEEVSRKFLFMVMTKYAECDSAKDGLEALAMFVSAIEKGKPYDVIFMDIMMPNMNGQIALQEIRIVEKRNGMFGRDACKIIMTTALHEYQYVSEAFKEQADGYLIKPIIKEQILEELEKNGIDLRKELKK